MMGRLLVTKFAVSKNLFITLKILGFGIKSSLSDGGYLRYILNRFNKEKDGQWTTIVEHVVHNYKIF